jgi:16S rRNA (guanine966-N2)-methyltransferase
MSDAGRVIAGSARGTRLVAPGAGTRPLGDRVKQTLFAILEPDLRGAAVLDLFAGSGAGGIEALSRGAARAVFVERDAVAARVIVENLVRARLAERGTVARADALTYLAGRAAADGPFDVVLIDPPYGESHLLEAALIRLGAGISATAGASAATGASATAGASAAGPSALLLRPEAWVVAKHFWRTPPPPAAGLLESVRTRRFGETALTFFRQAGSAPRDAEDSAAVTPARPAAESEEAAR